MEHWRTQWIESTHISNSWRNIPRHFVPRRKTVFCPRAQSFIFPLLGLRRNWLRIPTGSELGFFWRAPVMLRIPHLTYKWGKSAKEKWSSSPAGGDAWKPRTAPLSIRCRCIPHGRLYPLRSVGEMQSGSWCGRDRDPFPCARARTHARTEGEDSFFFNVPPSHRGGPTLLARNALKTALTLNERVCVNVGPHKTKGADISHQNENN